MKDLYKIALTVLLAVQLLPLEMSGQPGGQGFVSPEVRRDRTTFITDGGHTWMNCKKFLNETAQLLFK